MPANVTEINYPHPNPSYLWVPEPKTRGTFGIFSLCLSTLFVCAWQALHRDIPAGNQSQTRSVFNSILWMTIALLFPELILTRAIMQWFDARTLLQAAATHLKRGLFDLCPPLHATSQLDYVPFPHKTMPYPPIPPMTIVPPMAIVPTSPTSRPPPRPSRPDPHKPMPYPPAPMAIVPTSPTSRSCPNPPSRPDLPSPINPHSLPDEPRSQDPPPGNPLPRDSLSRGPPPGDPPSPPAGVTSLQPEKVRRNHNFTLVHAFYATMGGYAVEVPSIFSESLAENFSKYKVLSPEGVLFLMKYFPEVLPDITEVSITERAATDGVGKFVLLLQVTWFCMNCISRLQQRLPEPSRDYHCRSLPLHVNVLLHVVV
jgi:hypothetical protein